MVESAPSVNNILCGTESWFTQRTVDPTFTVMLAGSNAKFFMGIVLADTEVVVCGAGMVVTVGSCVVCRGAGTVAGGRTDGVCLGTSAYTNEYEGNNKKNETAFHRLISTVSPIIT